LTPDALFAPVAVFAEQLDLCSVQTFPFEVLDEVLDSVFLPEGCAIVLNVVEVENVRISLPTEDTLSTGLLNKLEAVFTELTALLL